MRLDAGGAPVAVKRRSLNWSTEVITSLYYSPFHLAQSSGYEKIREL
jgi:hypothetical protein